MNANHSEEQTDLLFIANEPETEIKVVLFGYITPIFFMITLMVNIVIVLVLSRPTMRSPTNLVLLWMAVSDLLTLIFPVPWYFYMYTLGFNKYYLYPAFTCNVYHIMIEILPTFFHTASIWCTLLLACQRYIYICHPITAIVWCTIQRVSRSIVIIFVFAFFHQLARFFERHYVNDILPDNPLQSACRLVSAKWLTSIEDFYFGSYFVFRIFFVHIGPCLLLVIFNLLLYNALKEAEMTRKKLFMNKNELSNNASIKTSSMPSKNGSNLITSFVGGSTSGCSIEPVRSKNLGRDCNSTTVMLIVIVTVFLTVEIPLAIATAVHVMENMFSVDIVSDRFLYLTIIFSNFFIIISYPLKFAIYCGMSCAFRKTFKKMFIHNVMSTLRPANASLTQLTQLNCDQPTKTTTNRLGTAKDQITHFSASTGRPTLPRHSSNSATNTSNNSSSNECKKLEHFANNKNISDETGNENSNDQNGNNSRKYDQHQPCPTKRMNDTKLPNIELAITDYLGQTKTINNLNSINDNNNDHTLWKKTMV